MQIRFKFLHAGIVFGGLLAGFPIQAQSPTPASRNVVLWISIDGFRGDYIGRTPLPFFDRMVREGDFTRHLQPVFPPITFPSHTVEMTGVPPEQNGITGNSMLDERTGKVVHFPHDATLIEAEPLWVTAEKQGARTGVFDWPLSQNQAGDVKASYFLTGYDEKLTDEQRLAQLLAAWTADQAATPLRLLIGYVPTLDHAGHLYGPDAPEITAALKSVDTDLGVFLGNVLQLWNKKMTKNDHLYLLITTDHGMETVRNIVNAHRLASALLLQDAEIVSNGPMASYYFPKVPPDQLASRVAEVKAQMATQPFLDCYLRSEIPAAWHYQHPLRVGDLLVVLKPGYTFGKTKDQDVSKGAEATDVHGMHGYPLEVAPHMEGTLLLWRYPDPLTPHDLGNISTLQVEPTVAQMLGISKSPAAKGEPFKW